MYRGRLWTMRQYAGFGTADETNRRFKYLLQAGETGLSLALDLPTQIGYDSDAPEAHGEVGRVGVAISSLEDMEAVFEGIPLEEISTSITINGTAPVILALYQAVAEKQGVPPEKIRGTIQNDPLKEFVARGTWNVPVEPAVRLAIDAVEYCVKTLPKFNPISIAGAHYRDAGATPAEEMAYTLADGLAYVEETLKRGLNIDEFAPRFSWFFYTYTNFFEEVAKYRAGRRIWARWMRERFGAKDPNSWKFRVGCACGGKSLAKREPLNNLARLAIQMIASAAAGLQSVFTEAYDEAYALPTEESAKLALRVQQIVAYETDVAKTVDPLGGSYFVEALTNEMETQILSIIEKIESLGGMIRCVREGIIHRWLSERAYEQQKRFEAKEEVLVGENLFRTDEETPDLEIHTWDPKVEEEQIARLERLRRERNNRRVKETLSRLRKAAEEGENVMPFILEAVRSYATVGEIMGVLREVFGEYRPPVVF